MKREPCKKCKYSAVCYANGIGCVVKAIAADVADTQ